MALVIFLGNETCVICLVQWPVIHFISDAIPAMVAIKAEARKNSSEWAMFMSASLCRIRRWIILYLTMSPILLSTVLCFINFAAANIFEYQTESQPFRPCELQRESNFLRGEDYIPQCSEDGQFRNIQCDNNSLSCWCVNSEGIEVPGSKTTGSPAACLSFCQLQKQQVLVSRYINSSTTSYVPQCLDSGDFDPIQCDFIIGQCWCVDAEGMEIYGTRQRGKRTQCPGKCEIRDRRILHGVGEKSPPQCSAAGEFLPVQCKFVNMTDMMVFDLIHNYNRFPEAFLTFQSFSRSFPEVSGYCFCADSLGRELQETGLEMLLENVYDTIFASLEPSHTFTGTSMYRILQRRFLGVQLATSGRFRCPSKCETERSTAIRFRHSYQPWCEEDGAYKPLQCASDNFCWCVDPSGQEVPGTRRQGQNPTCGGDDRNSCPSDRQQSLSRLFYGPGGHFSQHNLFSASLEELQKTSGFSRTCPPAFKELFLDSGLLSSLVERPAGAPELLRLESILSEAIGGMFPSSELAYFALQFSDNPNRFQENFFGGKFLKNLISFNFTGALGTNSKLNFDRLFQPIGTNNGFAELADQLLLKVQEEEFNLSQPLVDNFGRTINLLDNRNAVQFLASALESPEFFPFLKHLISLSDFLGEDLGDVAKVALKSKKCKEQAEDLFVPTCTNDGRYEEIQCYAGECWCVDMSGTEILGTRVLGRHPRCPTKCEKQREHLHLLQKSQPAGSDLFIPSCTREGNFLPVQCHGSNCFCVNSEGRIIPGIAANPGGPMQCPSDCQLAGSQAFLTTVQQLLSVPTSLPELSSIYVPQCSLDGQWRQVQCNGPPEQAFEWYQRWITQNNNGRTLPFVDLMDLLLDYKERSQQSFETFVQILYEAGHQNIFPVFSNYPSFTTVPREVLEENATVGSLKNILMEPLTFWQLLQGQLVRYPGSYGDFSTPLGHFDLRNCWCVDGKGQMQESQADMNKVPECRGTCEVAKQKTIQFVAEVEELIKDSNSSHFPFGQSFLITKGIRLTGDEFLNLSQSEIMLSERLLTGNDYAVRLAAQSTLNFYRRSLLASRSPAGDAVRLGFQPYVPQCDGLGNWEPLQCYESSGHCWCVDERGRYISDSLVTRSTRLPRCQTPCQRSRTNALVSSWRRNGSQLNVTTAPDLFIPSCLETGEYALLQKSNTETWCVDPASGEVLQNGSIDLSGKAYCPTYCSMLKSKALLREIGRGYIPECQGDSGVFSSMQCDEGQESCWCVFEDGTAAPGTRDSTERSACERPQCQLPFHTTSVVNGGVFCNASSATQKVQKCRVICNPSFHSVLSSAETLLCDMESRLWIGEPPHSQTCQSLQPFHNVQTQAHFQLLLPPEKACSSDYSGLLEAFQIFILDEMKARGFCHIQVNALGHLVSVPVCGSSAVLVECLANDRLGVNVTWSVLLENVPAASLPDLHNIEKAMIGEDLAGRFEALIRSGNFILHLDSKPFRADPSSHFLRDADFDVAPQVSLGCSSGFQKVPLASGATPGARGCAACPPGSYFKDDGCLLCPPGFYQHQAGSLSCVQCPLGKTTVSAGAFQAEHCLTDCQMDERNLLCDKNGQYIPSYEDPDTKKSFCVDRLGQVLDWTGTDGPLPHSQCLVLMRFERVPAPKLFFMAEKAEMLPSRTVQGQPENVLRQCVAECDKDEACGFLVLSAEGSETLCELYSAAESNFNCSASGQIQGVWNNAASTRITHLSCLLRVRSQEKDVVGAFLKKGQEFTTAGTKAFEMTDFQDVVSGMYSNVVLSAAGSSLTDVHLFCRQTCSQDACCDGFILSQNILDGGSIMCGLISYPDVLICNANDWNGTSAPGRRQRCTSEKYDEEKKQYVFRLGGHMFAGTSEFVGKSESSFSSFQRVYLWRDSDMATRVRSSVCDGTGAASLETEPFLPDSPSEVFSRVDSSQIQIDQNRFLPSQKYWLFKPRYSAEQALLWCLASCAEDKFCQLADMPNVTTGSYFPCTLYPGAYICDNFINNVPENCSIVLPRKPNNVHQKTVSPKGSVENFYTRSLFRRVSEISVRDKIDVSGKSVSNGFFDCERLCDADPCCTGFGLLNTSQMTGGKVQCLILNSLGIQTCSEELRSDWRVSDCASPVEIGTGIHPFGWYQKASSVPLVCPPVRLPGRQENVSLDQWQRIDVSSTVTDSSLSKFDILHISQEASSDFVATRDFCLSDIAPLTTQTSDTRTVYIPSKGSVFGTVKAVRVGSDWKRISQFLGIPYAAPPISQNRFRSPQAFTWVESWNATTSRASCWQPGDSESDISSVSEDCLYLNVYVPDNTAGNLPVLLFFHNGISSNSDQPRTVIDGSYLAGSGNIVVVTANYRTGVFGFLSTGSSAASGNWGLLDQEAVLKWTQENIANFGGDPHEVTLAADRGGADVASIHLFAGAVDSGLFKKALLMGGSAFSPVSTISQERAREQTAVLARELGCPSTSNEETLSCLRQLPAKTLNDQQTRLLAVSGPFQYWSPVADGTYLRDPLTSAPRLFQSVKIDLLIGNAQQDGLISRSKAIKRFEESQGRANSKTAFYQALQNSLGGEQSNPLVQDAATWFYSLQHSATDYASFSRALENATRDHFIICPTIDMAKYWAANNRGNVFVYHVPESASGISFGLELLPDVQFMFGFPFHPRYENQYTLEEKTLSLAIMQYLANFIKSGNPNNPYQFSRKVTGIASPWPAFRADAEGDNYKEFTTSLENRKGLKRAECSFWSDYIRILKTSTSVSDRGKQPATSPLKDEQSQAPVLKTTPMKPLKGKVEYSR